MRLALLFSLTFGAALLLPGVALAVHDYDLEEVTRFQTAFNGGVPLELEVEIINDGFDPAPATTLQLRTLARNGVPRIVLDTIPLAGIAARATLIERVTFQIPDLPYAEVELEVEVDPTGATGDVRSDNVRGVGRFLVGVAWYQMTTSAITGYQSIVGQPGTTTLFAPGADEVRRVATELELPFEFRFRGGRFSRLGVAVGGACVVRRSDGPVRSRPFLGSPGEDDVIAVLGRFLGLAPLPLGADSEVAWRIDGMAPSRVLTVEWARVRRGSGTEFVSGQLRLFEDQDRVELRYPDPATQFSGLFDAAGIANRSGDIVYEPFGQFRQTAKPTLNVTFTHVSKSGLDLQAGFNSAFPVNPEAGRTVVISARISNPGSSAASASAGLYLSTDEVIDGGDTRIGGLTLPVIAPGEAMEIPLVGTIPLSTPPSRGTADVYFLGVIVDETGALTELDERNNVMPGDSVFVKGVDAVPQLEALSFHVAQSTVAVGDSLDVTATVRDRSMAPFPPRVDLAIVVSRDDRLDGGDAPIEILERSISRTGTTITAQPIISPAVLPGSRFVFFHADFGHDRQEIDESDNVLGPIPLTVTSGPGFDLVTERLELVPGIVEPGGTFTVRHTIANVGLADATGPLQVRFDLFDPRTTIGTVTLSTLPLTAGARVETVHTLTVPAGTPRASRYIEPLIIGTSGEPTVNNGVLFGRDGLERVHIVTAQPGTVPHEVLSKGKASANVFSAAPGETIQFQAPDVVNLGETFLAAVKVEAGFRLGARSYEVVREATVQLIPSRGGRVAGPMLSLRLPVDLTPGPTLVRFVVDSDDALAEVDEEENDRQELGATVVVEPRAPGINLQPLAVRALQSQATYGGPLRVEVRVANAGENPAPDFPMRLIVSTDAQLDGGDARVALSAFPAGVRGGSRGRAEATATIPGGVPGGVVFLGLEVDSGDVIAELNEGDNRLLTDSTLMILSNVPCDVSINGRVDVVDVQQAINAALGVSVTGTEDVNGDGSTDVTDVQLVINGALGGSCP